MASVPEEEQSTLSSQQQQQASVCDAHAVPLWQARLAGHAEAIQQLDRDSLCRMSDPCQQPSKRSRSCPPDSFGAAPHCPADSTDAVHAMHSGDEISDCDDAMSGQASDTHSAEQKGQSHHSSQQQQHQHVADDSLAPAGHGVDMMVKQLSSMAPAVASLAAQQQDSLDMTQPNLTPADQQHRLHGQGSTDPNAAPVRPFPCTSPVSFAVDLDADPDCDRLAAAPATMNALRCELQSAAGSLPDQGQQQQQQQPQVIGRKGSGPFGLGKGKAAKWKQRSPWQDAGFGENEQPLLVAPGNTRHQGDVLSQMTSFPWKQLHRFQ